MRPQETQKSKGASGTVSGECSEVSGSSGSSSAGDLKLNVSRMRMTDYETHHHNKQTLKGIAQLIP